MKCLGASEISPRAYPPVSVFCFLQLLTPNTRPFPDFCNKIEPPLTSKLLRGRKFHLPHIQCGCGPTTVTSLPGGVNDST